MAGLFLILFFISIIILIIGIIKPNLVIRWGDNRNRKSVFKVYGLAIVVFFVLFIISTPLSSIETIDENGEKNEDTIEETEKAPYSKEIEKIYKNISDAFKGENHSIEIDGEEGNYKVSIAFDAEDDRFSESIWCGINGLGFLEGMKYYQPELDEEIKIYELVFFAKNTQTYSAIVDNLDITEVTELDLVSHTSEEDVIVTADDVKKFHEKEAVEEENEEKKREFVIGKCDKDFLEVTNIKPGTIRNDVTEKWRMVKFAEPINTLEYLLSYNDMYMDKNTSVHVLINFTYGTTTLINDFGTYLDVSVFEYQDKEEHDAKKIGTGFLLGEYQIYKDNGDIVDFEKVIEAEENEG